MNSRSAVAVTGALLCWGLHGLVGCSQDVLIGREPNPVMVGAGASLGAGDDGTGASSAAASAGGTFAGGADALGSTGGETDSEVEEEDPEEDAGSD